jgi:hypothetical protein
MRRQNALARRHTALVLALYALIICLSVLRSTSRLNAQPAGPALEAAVDGFLSAWIVKRDPDLAVRQFVSQTLDDERFVPAQWYSAAEYHRRFDGEAKRTAQKIPNQEFARRMRDYLAQLLPPEMPVRASSVQQALGPFSMESVRANPGLSKLLVPHEPRQLLNIPGIAYNTKSWDDISWTASGTIGLRTALQERFPPGGQTVVVHPTLDPSQPRSPLLFMLWAPEGPQRTWKLWAVEPVSVE